METTKRSLVVERVICYNLLSLRAASKDLTQLTPALLVPPTAVIILLSYVATYAETNFILLAVEKFLQPNLQGRTI